MTGGLGGAAAPYPPGADPPAPKPTGADLRGRLMLAFEGRRLPAWLADRLRESPAAGVTLFRWLNVDSPGQVRELTEAIQAAARPLAGGPAEPLLVAADQEGGQLLALGSGPTEFAGNLALGAAGEPELTRRVGRAIGLELRAMGVNVLYAPVADLLTSAASPSVGIRSFGADPAAVAGHVAALVSGVQEAGVAATAKHFPGSGDVLADPHHHLGSIDHDRARLAAVELVPFQAAIDAGVRLVMPAHIALPAITGRVDLPVTLSRLAIEGLLRGELGFGGVTISDALDMGAIAAGPDGGPDVVAALAAGIDLLLCSADRPALARIEARLSEASGRGLPDPAAVAASAARVRAVRRWLGATGPTPDLGVVGSVPHVALARELAERSMTLVRDDTRQLPLRSDAGSSILAIMPVPRDLTPADTSSAVRPALGAALRRHHPSVDEIVTRHPPTGEDVAAIGARLRRPDPPTVVVIGTINAATDSAQAALVRSVIATGVPTVTVALRVPTDLAAYPDAPTHACTYSILPASLDALADALFGRIPFRGRLPLAIPGIARVGHGLAAGQ